MERRLKRVPESPSIFIPIHSQCSLRYRVSLCFIQLSFQPGPISRLKWSGLAFYQSRNSCNESSAISLQLRASPIPWFHSISRCSLKSKLGPLGNFRQPDINSYPWVLRFVVKHGRCQGITMNVNVKVCNSNVILHRRAVLCNFTSPDKLIQLSRRIWPNSRLASCFMEEAANKV